MATSQLSTFHITSKVFKTESQSDMLGDMTVASDALSTVFTVFPDWRRWRVGAYWAQLYAVKLGCGLCSAQCTVHSALCTVHCVQCMVFSTQCSVHGVLYTVFSTQCSVHSVQYTVFSTWSSVQYSRLAHVSSSPLAVV